MIFADEPTGNLDSKTTVEVMNTILQMVRKYHITFVMVTHERDLSAYADRIITLKDGQILSDEYPTKQSQGELAQQAAAAPEQPMQNNLPQQEQDPGAAPEPFEANPTQQTAPEQNNETPGQKVPVADEMEKESKTDE